jgi:TolB protein
MFGGVEHWIATADRSGLVLVSRGTSDANDAPLTSHGFWPAWHPDGDRLAASVLDVAAPASTVELYARSGEHLRTLHSPAGQVAVIAPRVPHYAMWSPRGDVLSFIAPSTGGLALFLSETEGTMLSQRVMSGGPVFSAFSPDGARLAVHVGTELALVDIDGAREPVPVGPAAGFRTPAFSSDGSALVFGRVDQGTVRLLAAAGDGTDERDFGAFAGALTFAFRPGTGELAAGVSHAPNTGVVDEIWLVDVHAAAEGARRLLCRGPIQSFAWSPDGQRLATVMPAQTGDGRYFVRVFDADGAVAAQSPSFVPSADVRTMTAFFDQYARSHTIWSPDSRHLVLAGRAAGDEVSQSFGDPAGPYVHTWEVARGQPLVLLRKGEVGFFQLPQ